MSIRVRGTIAIVRKSSRRGDFNVGDLATEIGEFEVKDSLIEEYEPGHYTGEFLIKWIEPDSFAWRGKVFVKNRATLDEIFIDEAEEGGTPPAPPPEPDPIDSTPEAAPVAVKTTHRHQSTEASVSASPSPSAPAPSSTQAQAPAHASPEKLDKPTGESTTKDARAADTNAADVDADAARADEAGPDRGPHAVPNSTRPAEGAGLRLRSKGSDLVDARVGRRTGVTASTATAKLHLY